VIRGFAGEIEVSGPFALIAASAYCGRDESGTVGELLFAEGAGNTVFGGLAGVAGHIHGVEAGVLQKCRHVLAGKGRVVSLASSAGGAEGRKSETQGHSGQMLAVNIGRGRKVAVGIAVLSRGISSGYGAGVCERAGLVGTAGGQSGAGQQRKHKTQCKSRAQKLFHSDHPFRRKLRLIQCYNIRP